MAISIKLILAISLLICLFDMPYGYYQFVRLCAFIGFGFLAFKSYKIEDNNMLILYAGLAILFQPFYKIALGKEIWIIVDLIVGIGLLAGLIIGIIKTKR